MSTLPAPLEPLKTYGVEGMRPVVSQTKPIQESFTPPAAESQLNRAERFTSHALVELRRFKHLPFGVHSAVLLDISLGGFKAEFTGEIVVHPGQTFWISIPLMPLGIYAPSKLLCKGECRWFDDKKFRVGGVFMHLSKTEQHVIDQVLDTLKQRDDR